MALVAGQVCFEAGSRLTSDDIQMIRQLSDADLRTLAGSVLANRAAFHPLAASEIDLETRYRGW